MAEATAPAVTNDQSNCFICSGKFNDPIGLPCGHGFCYECLDTWYNDSKDKTDKAQVICPVCKKPADIPKDGIRGFPKFMTEKDSKDVVDTKKVSKHLLPHKSFLESSSKTYFNWRLNLN